MIIPFITLDKISENINIFLVYKDNSLFRFLSLVCVYLRIINIDLVTAYKCICLSKFNNIGEKLRKLCTI